LICKDTLFGTLFYFSIQIEYKHIVER